MCVWVKTSTNDILNRIIKRQVRSLLLFDVYLHMVFSFPTNENWIRSLFGNACLFGFSYCSLKIDNNDGDDDDAVGWFLPLHLNQLTAAYASVFYIFSCINAINQIIYFLFIFNFLSNIATSSCVRLLRPYFVGLFSLTFSYVENAQFDVRMRKMSSEHSVKII